MDFKERNIQKERYLKIKNLFVTKKYDSLIKNATMHLSLVPNDIEVRFMRAKAYRKKGMFKECLEDLKYNLSLGENKHSIVELFYLLYHLNMYEDAIELLPTLYNSKYMKPLSLIVPEAVMKKQLGLPFKTRIDSYTINQINNYNAENALEHIKENHLELNELKNNSCFNKNIDLYYLYETVLKNLKNSKKANIYEVLEIHYFSVPNIGDSNNNFVNFIKVILIPNTNQILDMYPVVDIDDAEYTNLVCDMTKLFKANEKTKTISRIDKFNKRYNL